MRKIKKTVFAPLTMNVTPIIPRKSNVSFDLRLPYPLDKMKEEQKPVLSLFLFTDGPPELESSSTEDEKDEPLY